MKIAPYETPALSKTAVCIVLASVLAGMTVVSIFIPLFSQGCSQTVPSISHPRLYPFYYQTNLDAPMELRSSLGFPGYFRSENYRVNRPLIIGLAAGIRFIVMPALRPVLPGFIKQASWEGYPAADVLATYATMIALNILMIFLAGLLYYSAGKAVIGSVPAIIASLILITTPIVILSIREISQGAVQILIAAASVYFWEKALLENPSIRRICIMSLAIGFLFLGKFAVTTFCVGLVLCLFTPRRKHLALILTMAIAPAILWRLGLFFADIPYKINEIDANTAFIKSVCSGSLPTALFDSLNSVRQWIGTLWESSGLLHLPLLALGAYVVWVKSQRYLLLWLLLFGLADAVFYFFLHRFHAVYGIHTMLFLFPVLAIGICLASEWICRTIKKTGDQAMIAAALILVLLIQASVIIAVVPRYCG